jgi:hypothetical protein
LSVECLESDPIEVFGALNHHEFELFPDFHTAFHHKSTCPDAINFKGNKMVTLPP